MLDLVQVVGSMLNLEIDILDKFIEVEELIVVEHLTEVQLIILKKELINNTDNLLEYIDNLIKDK